MPWIDCAEEEEEVEEPPTPDPACLRVVEEVDSSEVGVDVACFGMQACACACAVVIIARRCTDEVRNRWRAIADGPCMRFMCTRLVQDSGCHV